MKWWGLTVNCPDCKSETTLQFVMFSADGELKFTTYCPHCKEIITYKCYASFL
jgi:predicted Zn-ribbon and HTH transcriptional regulator